MGPPKDNPRPFFFGQNFQENPLVNDDSRPDSPENEDDVDTKAPQNVFLASKQYDDPQTAGRQENSAHILQSSSLPTISPPNRSKVTVFPYRARFLDQDSETRTEDKETNNLQVHFLEDKPSTQIDDDSTSADDSVLQSSSHNVTTPDSLPVEGSFSKDKLLDESQSTSDTENDVPKDVENSSDFKEAGSSNLQSDAARAREAQNASFEIAKKNLLISMAQSKAFDDFIVKRNQKKALTNSTTDPTCENSVFTTVKNSFFAPEKKNLQKPLPATQTAVNENAKVQETEKKTLQTSSAESNVENPPIPQYSETFSVHSNYEEREELLFFDRAKFIAICGEDFFDQSQEPWPQDVKLYQPYEVEQVILPDNANCLAVQAFLKMCGLDFQTEQRHNAEYMSPSGRVPFIKCGAFVVSELDPIIAFINTKGISLTGQLDAGQRADMRAYMSLANTVLANAELYVAWVDSTTANAVTRPRYGSVHPWPLNHIVTWQKGRQVRKRLAVLGWLQKSLQEVYAEVENCCNALSERLDKKDFFFGTRPTELDALVFGHLFTVLTTPLPSNRLASIVRGYPALVELVKRIEKQFFQREN